MRNKILLLATIAACICLALIGCENKEEAIMDTIPSSAVSETSVSTEEVKDEYPQIVYINDILYKGTGNVCEQVPRKAPDGIIETFVEPEIMPDAVNSANFGSEYMQMEYMFLEDGTLIVRENETWIIFDELDS